MFYYYNHQVIKYINKEFDYLLKQSYLAKVCNNYIFKKGFLLE